MIHSSVPLFESGEFLRHPHLREQIQRGRKKGGYQIQVSKIPCTYKNSLCERITFVFRKFLLKLKHFLSPSAHHKFQKNYSSLMESIQIKRKNTALIHSTETKRTPTTNPETTPPAIKEDTISKISQEKIPSIQKNPQNSSIIAIAHPLSNPHHQFQKTGAAKTNSNSPVVKIEIPLPPVPTVMNKMLDSISTHINEQMRQVWELFLKKFNPEDLKEWNCDKEGNFVLTLNRPLKMWVPSKKEDGTPDPPEGVVLILGEPNKVLKGCFKKNNSEKSFLFEKGFNVFLYYNVHINHLPLTSSLVGLVYKNDKDVTFKTRTPLPDYIPGLFLLSPVSRNRKKQSKSFVRTGEIMAWLSARKNTTPMTI